MDVTGLLAGFALGVFSSGLFFAGLFATVRASATARSPGALLAVSAAVRLVLFMIMAYFALQFGLESAAGFAVAFPLVRQVAIALGRPRPGEARSA